MSYTVDESNRTRQEGLAAVLDPASQKFLRRLPLESGAEVLDVGCGLGFTTELLAEVLPAPERVIGLDADGDLVLAGRERLGEDAGPIELQEGDATDLPFPDDSFDLVFARFLLAHLPDPAAAAAEFRRVCRPGGIVCGQEPDFASIGSDPPRVYRRAVELAGQLFDTEAGRKLHGWLAGAGLRIEGVGADVRVEAEDRLLRRQAARDITALAPALLGRDLISDEDWKAVEAGIREGVEAGGFFVNYTVISVWGRA